MLKIGWFSTARGDSSRNLLMEVASSIEKGELKASIEFVFCSREQGEAEKTDNFIDLVHKYQIPLVCLSVKKFAAANQQNIAVKGEQLPDWRMEYDRRVMALLKDYNVDVCVLAGYMLIVSSEMCSKYNMINLHPALPDGPKGTWQEVIWQLINEKAKRSGVMMHLVTPELDRGPVITYCGYPITGHGFDSLWNQIQSVSASTVKTEQSENNELFKAIRKAGFSREIPLIIHTLKAFSEGRIRIDANKKLVDASGKAINGFDLTAEIDRAIQSVK